MKLPLGQESVAIHGSITGMISPVVLQWATLFLNHFPSPSSNLAPQPAASKESWQAPGQRCIGQAPPQAFVSAACARQGPSWPKHYNVTLKNLGGRREGYGMSEPGVRRASLFLQCFMDFSLMILASETSFQTRDSGHSIR